MLHLLFLGNSYTFVNELDQVTLGVFQAADPGLDAEAVRLAEAGYTFPMHLAQADGTNGATAWSDALVTGSTDWDWVMLQDQSQIPGFPADNADYLASVDALAGLDAMVAAKHAQPVLLMTWGRLHGDDANPDRYPDYPTMQALLAEGYEAYAASIRTPEHGVWVAPAGYAWRHIYEAEVAAGQDPTQPGTLFAALYQSDGSHPSPAGTYLAACVVYATITGQDPTGLPAPDAVPADAVAELQQAAAAAVFDESPELVYPWQDAVDPGGDTAGDTAGDSADTAPDSASDADTGADAAGDTADDAPGDGASTGGCGCASAPAGGTGLAALLGVLALRRRR